MKISFRSILKTIGLDTAQIGLDIAPALGTALGGPLVGALVTVATHEIIKAAGTALSDPEKKNQVVTALEDNIPALTKLLPHTADVLGDPEKLASGTSTLVDGLVAVLKGVGAIPRSADASAPVGLPTAANPAVAPPATLPPPAVLPVAVPAPPAVVTPPASGPVPAPPAPAPAPVDWLGGGGTAGTGGTVPVTQTNEMTSIPGYLKVTSVAEGVLNVSVTFDLSSVK